MGVRSLAEILTGRPLAWRDAIPILAEVCLAVDDAHADGLAPAIAFELLTGYLPFPDAKGPAGLITAQLKQTPPVRAVGKATHRFPGVPGPQLPCRYRCVGELDVRGDARYLGDDAPRSHRVL